MINPFFSLQEFFDLIISEHRCAGKHPEVPRYSFNRLVFKGAFDKLDDALADPRVIDAARRNFKVLWKKALESVSGLALDMELEVNPEVDHDPESTTNA